MTDTTIEIEEEVKTPEQLAIEAEAKRISDKLEDYRSDHLYAQAMLNLGINPLENNFQKRMIKMVHANDEQLVSIDAEITKLRADKLIESEQQNIISYGKKIKSACESTLEFVTGMNAVRGLTIEQVDTIQERFSEIEKSLRSHRVDKAMILLSSMESDEFYSQEDIDKIMAHLQSQMS